MIYTKYIKHWFDIIMAIVMGGALIPIFILLCLLLLITQGKSIFFIQARSGINMKTFSVYKFRTLQQSGTNELSMDNRKFTFLGKMMRRTGIDELPQFYNILKGDMSFIGPRPMPVEYNDRYQAKHLDRFKVKPGITGLAQIHGKNDISWGERFDLDIAYAHNISFVLDAKIVLKTISQIGEALLSPGKKEPEMPVYNGYNLH